MLNNRNCFYSLRVFEDERRTSKFFQETGGLTQIKSLFNANPRATPKGKAEADLQ